LEEHFKHYISDEFTAEMEDELDDIANGDRKYEKTLKDFYTPFTKDVKSKDKIEKLTNMGPAPEEFKCPECNSAMVWKLSKNGRFMSCSKFPDCTGARKEDGDTIEPPKDLGKPCPKCGNPPAGGEGGTLVQKEGRFGMFITCSRYPKCKHVEQDPEEAEKAKTGVKCNVCNKGEMVERRGRFGLFYSCSEYPTCKHAIKAKPTGAICTMCGSLMMEGTKTIPERCSSKSCPMHNPHKLDEKKSPTKKK
jgi:DNA topoisomerase-1